MAQSRQARRAGRATRLVGRHRAPCVSSLARRRFRDSHRLTWLDTTNPEMEHALVGEDDFTRDVVVALASACNALFSASYQAFLPTIVAADDLIAANGRMEGSRVFAQVIGPGLAGALIQILQAPFALLADGASFLVSAVSIGLMRTVEARPLSATTHANI